jgi:hypothetical protein
MADHIGGGRVGIDSGRTGIDVGRTGVDDHAGSEGFSHHAAHRGFRRGYGGGLYDDYGLYNGDDLDCYDIYHHRPIYRWDDASCS